MGRSHLYLLPVWLSISEVGTLGDTMFVEELHAAIEKISGDIERRAQVLLDLETSRSVLHRQLNTILDQVAHLPLEISSEISIQCLPSLPAPGASHTPMFFLNICNAYTNIAISTPALWTAIRVVFPRVEGFLKVIEEWLQRSHNVPLSRSGDTLSTSTTLPPLPANVFSASNILKHIITDEMDCH
ncbi:hypothetical protein DFH07DRAFT_316269 [Mycena maculata]|uniref:Uncharacterized protein n=1 Tax=Mycena maculata TaxID=230809 RepID=A0AAD7HEY1_9AGAR|nr:hypothetical protein DFH07DRAFT_316269 [Mycena maculata]